MPGAPSVLPQRAFGTPRSQQSLHGQSHRVSGLVQRIVDGVRWQASFRLTCRPSRHRYPQFASVGRASNSLFRGISRRIRRAKNAGMTCAPHSLIQAQRQRRRAPPTAPMSAHSAAGVKPAPRPTSSSASAPETAPRPAGSPAPASARTGSWIARGSCPSGPASSASGRS